MMQSDVPPAPAKRKQKRLRGACDQTSAVMISVKERHAKALELRKAGLSYPKIAAQLGYNDGAAAQKVVARELQAITAEPAMELLALEVARLDTLLAGIWEEAAKGKDLAALDAARKLIMDRGKMLGLVTQKIEVQTPPREAMWERVAGWLAEPTPELEEALNRAGWVRVASAIETTGEEPENQ